MQINRLRNAVVSTIRSVRILESRGIGPEIHPWAASAWPDPGSRHILAIIGTDRWELAPIRFSRQPSAIMWSSIKQIGHSPRAACVQSRDAIEGSIYHGWRLKRYKREDNFCSSVQDHNPSHFKLLAAPVQLLSRSYTVIHPTSPTNHQDEAPLCSVRRRCHHLLCHG